MHFASVVAAVPLLVAAITPAPAIAQAFPTKPVRIIAPVAAGGNLDNVTRAVAQKVTEQLARQVVVESRPGASGVVGAEYVAKSQPDGYTYLSIATTFTSVPALLRGVGYDPVKDFTGVSLTAWLPQILVVTGRSPWKRSKS